MRTKLKRWLNRYLPSEFFGTLGALFGGYLADYFFHNAIVTALAATWGENTLYYGSMILREIQKQLSLNPRRTLRAFVKTFRNMVLEFGPTEYFDGIFIRPFFMYVGPKVTGNLWWGLIAGKLAADISFYIPTIISYELRSKVFGD